MPMNQIIKSDYVEWNTYRAPPQKTVKWIACLAVTKKRKENLHSSLLYWAISSNQTTGIFQWIIIQVQSILDVLKWLWLQSQIVKTETGWKPEEIFLPYYQHPTAETSLNQTHTGLSIPKIPRWTRLQNCSHRAGLDFSKWFQIPFCNV